MLSLARGLNFEGGPLRPYLQNQKKMSRCRLSFAKGCRLRILSILGSILGPLLDHVGAKMGPEIMKEKASKKLEEGKLVGLAGKLAG